MESKSKHLDETEYALLKQIHFRDGEILKLEHINAKYCREIDLRFMDLRNSEFRFVPSLTHMGGDTKCNNW